MNAPNLTFTELVDWIEGRLDRSRADAVAEAIAADERLTATAAWIAEFIDTARSLPLQAPPAELSARLRGLFDAHREGPQDGWSQARLLHDTREPALAGTRSGDGGEHVHLAFESDAGRFVVEVRSTRPGHVDLAGLLMLEGGTDRPVDLTLLETGVVRRQGRVAADGRFALQDVPDRVDQLRFTAPGLQVRATLDLTGR